MGILIVVAAGFFGFVCAVIAYSLGLGVILSLVIYALAGHCLCLWLLARRKINRNDSDFDLNSLIENDIATLLAQDSLPTEKKDKTAVSVFSLLRHKR